MLSIRSSPSGGVRRPKTRRRRASLPFDEDVRLCACSALLSGSESPRPSLRSAGSDIGAPCLICSRMGVSILQHEVIEFRGSDHTLSLGSHGALHKKTVEVQSGLLARRASLVPYCPSGSVSCAVNTPDDTKPVSTASRFGSFAASARRRRAARRPARSPPQRAPSPRSAPPAPSSRAAAC